MKIPMAGSAASKRRADIKSEYWPDETPWLGPAEIGFCCVPRTLPHVLHALSNKAVSQGKDLAPVYIDLLANHMGEGIVELGHADDHAFACGYAQVRTWRDRMHALEELGFVRTIVAGHKKYAKVLLVHPSVAMQRLRDSGRISEELWNAYRDRQRQVKEPTSGDVARRAKKKKAQQ